MKAIVIGGDSFIGERLAQVLRERGHEVVSTTRQLGREDAVFFDMLHPIGVPPCEVAFICAAVTRFIDCEQERDAYRVNVDAPVEIARQVKESGGKVVYLSSEAVERALHTAYGMHKALAEAALAGIGNAIIARLGKTTEANVESTCARLVSLAFAGKPGRYRLCQ